MHHTCEYTVCIWIKLDILILYEDLGDNIVKFCGEKNQAVKICYIVYVALYACGKKKS